MSGISLQSHFHRWENLTTTQSSENKILIATTSRDQQCRQNLAAAIASSDLTPLYRMEYSSDKKSHPGRSLRNALVWFCVAPVFYVAKTNLLTWFYFHDFFLDMSSFSARNFANGTNLSY